MIETFHLSRYESPSDAKCLIEVDDFVPLRFRTYERPLGASYLRLGDSAQTLVELLVDPMTGLFRGLTVTAFTALSSWPLFEARETSEGLHVFTNVAAWERKSRIDTGVSFAVAVRGSEVLVHWGPLDRCEATSFRERVRFLAVDRNLAGVRVAGLSPAEMKAFVTHAHPAS